MELNNELIPLRLSRVALLKAIDVSTNCCLGYHLALTHDPNQDDLLQLLDNITKRWMPIELTTSGIEYIPGSGFPTMWGDEFLHLTFGNIHLDNALMHMAETVKSLVCDVYGSTLHLGLPKHPKGRNWIEAAFNKINKTTHRFNSTTGSHPKDSIKESLKNFKKPPVLTLKTFEEALSVVIAEHNITPRKETGYAAPLSLLRSHIENHYIRLLPERHDQHWSPFEGQKQCPVIFLKNEQRAPFIRFLNVRYDGQCINNKHHIHKKIVIRFDRRDIRSAKAYTLEGEFLGILFAPRSWQRFAHSIATRRLIIKQTAEWKNKSKDPLAQYFHNLLIDKKSPSSALEIIRIVRERDLWVYNTDNKITSNSENIQTEQQIDRSALSDSSSKFDSWSSDWVDKRDHL